MSSHKLSFLINKDEKIIQCKKRAKEIFSTQLNSFTLTQCKTIAANELGFKDWFALYHSIKQKYSHAYLAKFESFLEDLLSFSRDENATDIHFICRKDNVTIKIRRWGDLFIYQPKDCFSYNDIIEFFNYLYSDPTYNKKFISECQFATLNKTIQGEKIKLQIQSIPAYPEGFDIVIQLLFLEKNISSLFQLGYTPEQINQLNDITANKHGSLIISGRTGSFFTSTARGLLKSIHQKNNYKKTIYSLENSPSILDSIHSIDVNASSFPNLHTKKSKYEEPMNVALNNKADVVMLEELRDTETVNILKNSIDKTFLITSVHASSALGIIGRLIDFGMPYHDIASHNFCHGFSYQTPIALVCPHCSHSISDLFEQPIIQNDNIVDINNNIIIKNYSHYLRFFKELQQSYSNVKIRKIKIRHYNGCSHCKNTGAIQQTICSEIIPVDDTIRQFIKNGKIKDLYLYWRSLSDKDINSTNMTGKTFKEHALFKVLDGLIDPLSFVKGCGFETLN